MELIQRAKNILLAPANEWQVIESESTDVGALYRGYVLPLAAIGPFASFVALALIGIKIPLLGTTYRIPLESALIHSVISYALTLAGVYLIALIINALAPTFGAIQNENQALKVAVYSSTAGWLAGVFAMVPALSVFGLLGLYSLYLLYAGLPALMKVPKEKVFAYTAVVVVCAAVLFVVIGAITGAVLGSQGPSFTVPEITMQ